MDYSLGKYNGKEGQPPIIMIRLKMKNRFNFFKSTATSFGFVNIYPQNPNHKYLRYFISLFLQYLVLKSHLGQNHLAS